MRNFSTVYLRSHKRQDFRVSSMTDNRSGEDEYEYEYIDTIFYIPADAKMDGL